MNRLEFASLVVKQCAKYHIDCVLVGGSCVSVYTNEGYVSDDLDFISPASKKHIANALREGGFIEEGRYFTHPDTHFYVEFPPGPLSIGSHIGVKPGATRCVNGIDIHLLSPTQSVMDRLSAWYHWQDRRSLLQAIDICILNEVDYSAVQLWSEKEGKLEAFKQFKEQLETANA